VDRGEQPGTYAVVATGMVPEIGQGADAQGVGVSGLVVAHEGATLLAVHGFGEIAIDQGRAVGGVPNYYFRHRGRWFMPTAFTEWGGAVLHALFFVSADCFGRSACWMRGWCRRRCSDRSCLDVLGVVDVAMVALAVVFPDSFQLAFHEVIDSFGDFAF